MRSNKCAILLTWICIIIPLSDCTFGAEFAVIAGLGAFGASLYQNFDKFLGRIGLSEYCSFKSTKEDWIHFNYKDLSKAIDTKVHGQHLVKEVVLKSLMAHFTNNEPSKALVLSFHGWTGGGKNFVASLIADSIYKRGMKSKFVHLFVSTIDFPHADKVDLYKLQLQDWIRGNVSECEHSLFIFDEIDKMPPGLIGAIKPFIDYHEQLFGVNFRKSIFIFLSNTGSRDVIKITQQNWMDGKHRSRTTYSDMEELILKGAFNEEGGLHQSDLIQHSLIDFYVPFLPLEREHVKLCIKDELAKRNVKGSPEFIQKVLDDIVFFPPGSKLFSTRGCKNVAAKVGYMLVHEKYDEYFN